MGALPGISDAALKSDQGGAGYACSEVRSHQLAVVSEMASYGGDGVSPQEPLPLPTVCSTQRSRRSSYA
jgi:hypothetical protein